MLAFQGCYSISFPTRSIMAADVEDLLIRPFRDVLAAGTAAAANALTHASQQGPERADRMSRAAQALIREGERALTKVQSVWTEQVQQHGDKFREAMVQQASIEKRRLQLEDLLWDFDDFTHPDEFDQARYSSLQAATKALALDIVETAKRLSLDTGPPPIPQGGFPPLPPLPTRAETKAGSRPSSAHSLRPRALSRPRPAQPNAGQQHAPLGSPRERGELPPQSPRITARSFTGPSNPEGGGEEDFGRAPALGPVRRRSIAYRAPSQPSRQDVSRDAFTPPASPGIGPMLSRFSDLTLNTSHRPKIFDPAPSPSTTHTRTSIISNLSNASSSSSAMLGSLDSLVIAEDEVMMIQPSAHLSPVANDPDHSMVGVDELLRESSTVREHRKSRPANPRIPDCAIREDSTYYRLKGLCRGATKFRKDGHWESIKLTSEYEYGSGGMAGGGEMMRASDGLAVPFQYEMTKVGACGDCGYAHDLDEVEMDKDNKPEAVRTSESGANYRLRLLFKSHLRQGASAETHYACLWCVQAGATIREGDATVFRSAEALLLHLARHPQPLPPLSGVNVQYGRLSDSTCPDFDLHLPDSPIPMPMPENVARLATAIAVKDHYRRPGRGKLEKPPKYDADMLEFMEGARIVGVIFPEKWGGKFCLGRHDGEFGAFPTKAIELRPPQESEIPVGGESGMSVITRWKWQPPVAAGVPWLAFGKGEVITNVQSLYADYWCWSGTNSKGKTGVFPQSYIDLETLRAQESTASKKQSRGRGLFGIRSNSTSEGTSKGKRDSVAS
ncbi:hypothetical protein VTI74DRAFT_10448 [Chaetomium olivicolor]